MMICDVICSAESEYVIYFLLTAYLETTHFGAMLPERLTKLPLAGSTDVEARFQSMMACRAKFKQPSALSDDKARGAMQEAEQIFETALVRLNFLKRTRAPLLTLLVVNEPVRALTTDHRKKAKALAISGLDQCA